MAKEMNGLRKIQYDCKKATFLIEKKQLTALSFREKWELKIHLTGCSICRIFEQQSMMINKMVHELFHSSTLHQSKLDEDYKKQLQRRIDKKMDNL